MNSNTIDKQDIVNAITDCRFKMYYQPIVKGDTKEVLKYEALIRLVLPDGRTLPPNIFFPVAKELKRHRDIVFKVAFMVIEKLKENNNIKIAFNISHEDIESALHRRVLLGMFRRNQDVIRDRLIVEIIETHKIKDIERTKEFSDELSKFGVMISLDDFGTEHSNLYLLSMINFDFLKIDGHFIQNINCEKTYTILNYIINLCKELKIPIIAEHIEDEKTFQHLMEIGVDYFQGFFFAKPRMNI